MVNLVSPYTHSAPPSLRVPAPLVDTIQALHPRRTVCPAATRSGLGTSASRGGRFSLFILCPYKVKFAGASHKELAMANAAAWMALGLPGKRLVSSPAGGEAVAGGVAATSPRAHVHRQPQPTGRPISLLVAAVLACWTAPGARTQSQDVQWQREPGRGPACCSFGGRSPRLDATLRASRARDQRACRRVS